MTSVTKNVFLVLFIMTISLLLFMLIFGDVGRQFIWGSIEPIFQATWERSTFNDGELIKQHYDQLFNSSTEILH